MALPNANGPGGVQMQEQVVNRHIKHLRLEGLTELTIYHRQRALCRLAAAIPCPVLEATDDQLYEWRATLAVADNTAAGYISHVKEFYRWALETGLIDSSPAEHLPVPKVRRHLPRPITERDLRHALETANVRMRAWLVLAAWCGLRACEIAAFRAEWLRLDDSPPHLIVVGKGGKERIVHVCAFAVKILRESGLPVKGIAFANARGGAYRPGYISKLANEHLHHEGITSTLHTLRARFATKLYGATKNPLLVRDELGHASVQTTEIYTLAGTAGAQAAVNKLPVPRGLRRAGLGDDSQAA